MLSYQALPREGNVRITQRKPVKFSSTTSRLLAVADAKPELNYIAGVALSDMAAPQSLLGNLVSADSGVALSGVVLTGIAIGWNYSDGICALISGVSQVCDRDNYRQKSQLAKGIINIVSGSQLLALSNNYGLFSYGALAGAIPLAAPAFALAMFADLINLTIDLYAAMQEVEFESWLDERMAELTFLRKRIAEENVALRRLEQDSAARQYKITEIRNLKARKEGIENDVGSRCRVYCHQGDEKSNIKWCETITHKLQSHHPRLVPACTRPWQHEQEKVADITRNNQIQHATNVQLREARKKVAVKALSFVGMTLAAVATFVACPPLAIAAAVICSVVAGYYLYQYVNKAKNSSFFNHKKAPATLATPTAAALLRA